MLLAVKKKLTLIVSAATASTVSTRWSNPYGWLETRPQKLTGALGVYFLQLGIRSNGKLSQNWAKIGTFDNAARIAHRDAAEAGLGTPRSIHTGHPGHTQLLQRGARALKRHKRGAPPG